MESLTIFSSHVDLYKVAETLRNIYQPENIEIQGDDDSWIEICIKKEKPKNSKIIFTNKVWGIKNDEFSHMVDDMFNFFYQINTDNEKIKQRLLAKINSVKLAIGIIADKEFSDNDYSQGILTIAKALDGIIFLDSGAMLDQNGKLILNINGDTELKYTVSEDAIDRKARSEKILQEKNIQINPDLLELENEDDILLREPEEVARRAMALFLVAVKGEGLEQDYVLKNLEKYSIEPYLTLDENEFIFNDTPLEKDMIRFQWRYESYWVMLWALGYIENLDFPDKKCNVKRAVKILIDKTEVDFINNIQYKTKQEILDNADLIYRYHWAIRDAQINKISIPGDLNPNIVLERHYALNWLIGYMGQNWDDITPYI